LKWFTVAEEKRRKADATPRVSPLERFTA